MSVVVAAAAFALLDAHPAAAQAPQQATYYVQAARLLCDAARKSSGAQYQDYMRRAHENEAQARALGTSVSSCNATPVPSGSRSGVAASPSISTGSRGLTQEQAEQLLNLGMAFFDWLGRKREASAARERAKHEQLENAEAAMERWDFQTADRLYADYIKKNPKDALSLLGVAKLRNMQARYQEALQLAFRPGKYFLTKKKDLAAPWWEQAAYAYEGLGKRDSAIVAFVLGKKPARAHELEQGERMVPLAMSKKIEINAPPEWRAEMKLMHDALRRGDSTAALAHAREAKRIYADGFLPSMYAAILTRQRDPAGAVENLGEAAATLRKLDLIPAYPGVFQMLVNEIDATAQRLFAQGNLAAAERAYRIAAAVAPEVPGYRHNLSFIQNRLGRTRDALANASIAHSSNALGVQSAALFAREADELNQKEEALEALLAAEQMPVDITDAAVSSEKGDSELRLRVRPPLDSIPRPASATVTLIYSDNAHEERRVDLQWNRGANPDVVIYSPRNDLVGWRLSYASPLLQLDTAGLYVQPAPEGESTPAAEPIVQMPKVTNVNDVMARLLAGYSNAYASLGIYPTAHVRIKVLADGSAAEVKIAQSSGYKRFDVLARDVARTITFEPARTKSGPVPIVITIPLFISKPE